MNTNDKKQYNPQPVEAQWQRFWDEKRIYQPSMTSARKPYYNLHMFPYPSAEGLHVGNVYAFTGADIHGRFKRQQGHDVFQPFGLDGFGIHSENYALKVGSHPMDQAEKSEKRFYDQVRSLGSGYDWQHTLETYDPEYYKWTQWIFIQLFKAGLAYRANVQVNWCLSCKTVLADEQVIDGQCERCGSAVEKKELEQWMFRITEYAEQLLEGLDRIDWTEKVKVAQRNWIGKSEGTAITFRVVDGNNALSVFTTRPDTLHGVTFLVVSPEHAVVQEWRGNPGVDEYIQSVAQRAKGRDPYEEKEKTGVFSGAYAINPINNQHLPIWIADYVVSDYGTGAIMAVPAHDQRDYEFARKYNLPIIQVVAGKNTDIANKAYIGNGKVINSGDWNGMSMPEDRTKIASQLQERQIGKRYTNYHLRDWLISRQRYWGPPIPMIFCSACKDAGRTYFDTDEGRRSKVLYKDLEQNKAQMAGWYPDDSLPVVLPAINDYKPLGTGNSPLGNHPEFYDTTCPQCGAAARRETDVSDTFLDSAWYFYRYISPWDNDQAWDISLEEKWLPPAIYTGGAEHSVLHLLYARFITKVFKDLDLVKTFDEPFPRFFAHGLIIKDGAKMSKSKGNVVVPDEYIKKFGSDTLRCYLMFLGPFDQGGDFRDSGIEGMNRFIKRVWTMFTGQSIIGKEIDSSAKSVMHQAIKKITDDIEAFKYNTAIAHIMTYYNYLSKKAVLSRDEARVFLQLLAPFAPHITEHLWQEVLGEVASIHVTLWPQLDTSAIKQEGMVIAVQINGKLRGALQFANLHISQMEIERIAQEDPAIRRHLDGKTITKAIYVPGKIINFVVG